MNWIKNSAPLLLFIGGCIALIAAAVVTFTAYVIAVGGV